MTTAADPALTAIVAELSEAAAHVDPQQTHALSEAIVTARRVYLTGAGRSGLIGRAFANRLLHLGVAVAVVGEPTTPPLAAGDLLIAVSGSGRTSSLLASAQKAKQLGAAVATITLSSEGPIAALCDVAVVLPGTTRLARETGFAQEVSPSAQPVGSLFEQLAWLVCDSVVMDVRQRTGQTNDDLIARHANLE